MVLVVKNQPGNVGDRRDMGSIPGSGRCPGVGVFLPGESHWQRSLAGYSPWGPRVGHDWATFTHSQKTKIMAPGLITSWQIDGETVDTVADFMFFGSKITEDGDCRHEIKRCLFLRRKVMTKLDSILKSRDITLSTKVHLVKAMAFPVVMYGC